MAVGNMRTPFVGAGELPAAPVHAATVRPREHREAGRRARVGYVGVLLWAVSEPAGKEGVRLQRVADGLPGLEVDRVPERVDRIEREEVAKVCGDFCQEPVLQPRRPVALQ